MIRRPGLFPSMGMNSKPFCTLPLVIVLVGSFQLPLVAAQTGASGARAAAPFEASTASMVPSGKGVAVESLTFDQFKAQFQPSDAWLLDRHGQTIGNRRINLQMRRLPWVPLSEVSPALIEAMLVAEDRRFFEHAGVDWLAVASAMWQRVKPFGTSAAVRGASSISMQVAAFGQAHLQRRGGPRKLSQKWDQMAASIALEKQWTKLEILEAYLNIVTYRGELQGLGAASWGLFDKAPSGLDKSESALLAALLRAPSATPTVVAKRACGILETTRPDALTCPSAHLADLVRLASLAPQPFENIAPHATVRLTRAVGPQASSLDTNLQRMARDALTEQVAALRLQGVEDGAAVVLDNATGQILAYVGSSGLLSRAGQVDAADAPRQAGSTLKPFLYGLAMDMHLLNAATLLDDSALAVGTDGGLYTPHNYDEQFVGPVSVRKALASSLNVPAVRALMVTGVEPLHRQLQALGLQTLHPKAQHYGYSLALGSADVKLLELTNAFRTLANGGIVSPPRWTKESSTKIGQRLFTAQTAWIIGSILSDNRARSHTFGFDSVLATPVWTAVKTGTSKDMRDNWCIGYSELYTVGVWVGNASGAPMRNVSGVSGAAPAWADIMRNLHRHVSSRPPPMPAGVVARLTRFEGDHEPARMEWYATAMAPPLERIAQADLALEAGGGTQTADGSVKGSEPSAAALVRLAQPAGSPRIIYPQNGALLAWDPDIPNRVQGVLPRHSAAGRTLVWQLNGKLLEADTPLIHLAPGKNTLRLLDENSRTLDTVQFEVRGMAAVR
jgi:penicillin-binding protein 1C